MRAAVLLGDGHSKVTETIVASPGPGEVLLKLEGCGVCASNLPAWQGRSWFQYPMEAGSPGHEPWGRVAERGDRNAPAIGTRVTGLSWRAYAEFDIARTEHLVPVPERYDDRPFPGEALACAMNVFERSAIERDMRVAVIGAGFIGGMLVQLATAEGASVTAFSQRQWSLDRAVDQGAVAAMPIEEGLAGTGSGNSPFDCVIECTGMQEGLDAASKLVGIRGRLVIAGYHQEGLRNINIGEWNWKGIDVINAHEREPARYVAGASAAIEAIEQKRVDPWPLFTHTVPLDRIDDAFDLMQSRPDGFTKAVLSI
jgi:threonine dehydrogenase-like Zn-dependent dehydrogenase